MNMKTTERHNNAQTLKEPMNTWIYMIYLDTKNYWLDLKKTRPLEEFGNETIAGHLGLMFEENSVREITALRWRHRFRHVFHAHENEKQAF